MGDQGVWLTRENPKGSGKSLKADGKLNHWLGFEKVARHYPGSIQKGGLL